MGSAVVTSVKHSSGTGGHWCGFAAIVAIAAIAGTVALLLNCCTVVVAFVVVLGTVAEVTVVLWCCPAPFIAANAATTGTRTAVYQC
jgi:hypothetical protein